MESQAMSGDKPIHIHGLPESIDYLVFPELPNGSIFGAPDRRYDVLEKIKKLIVDECKMFCELEDVATRTERIQEIVKRIAGKLRGAGMMCLRVKAGKGKTEASRQCKIPVWKGDLPPAGYPYDPRDPSWPPKGESAFSAPASMVITAADGTTWLPKFFVEKKLTEMVENAMYRRGSYTRTPAEKPAWPAEKEYLESLLNQLPSQERIDQAREAKKVEMKAELEARRKSEEEKKRARQIQSEANAAAWAKSQKEETEKLAKKRAKMEQVHDVDIILSKSAYEKVGNYQQLVRRKKEMKGVSLFFSGSRVYVVKKNGGEIISTRQNVEILMKEQSG